MISNKAFSLHSQEQKDLIENNDFGVMIRGDFSGMNKTNLLQLDEGMSNAAFVQFNRRDLTIGFIDSFAFVYFWKKEEAEKLLAKKLIIKNQKHYMISKPQKNTTIAIAPVYTTDTAENINQLLGIGAQFNQEDIASIIYPDDEYNTLVVDLKSRAKARQMKAYLFEKFKKIQEEFKEQQKRVSWADYELLRSSLYITFDNRLHNYKCDDLTFNEEIVKDGFQQTFITNVDRVELHFHSDGVLKGDGLLFFENTLNGERTVIKALNLSKEMRFVDIGDIRVFFGEKEDKRNKRSNNRRFFWPWMNNNNQHKVYSNVKGGSQHNHSYQQDQYQSMIQINHTSSPYQQKYQQQMQNLPYMNQDTTSNYAMNQMNQQFQIASNSRQALIQPSYLFQQQQYSLLPSNQQQQQFPQQQYPQIQYPQQYPQQYPIQQQNQYGIINQQNGQNHKNVSLDVNEQLNINIISINPQTEYQIQSNHAQSQHTYLPQFHDPSFNSIPSRQISPSPFSPIIQHQQQSIKIFKPELLIVQNIYEEEQINNLTQQQSQQDLINQIDNKSKINQPQISQKQLTLIPQFNTNKTILNLNAKEFKPQFKNIQSNSSSSSSISCDQQNIEQQSSLNQQVNSQINQIEDDNFRIYDNNDFTSLDKEIINKKFLESKQEDVDKEAIPIQKDNEYRTNNNIKGQFDIPVQQKYSPPLIQQIRLNSDDILPSMQNHNQIQIQYPNSIYPQQSSFQNSIDNKSVQNSESESTISESICSSTPSPNQSQQLSLSENGSLNSEDSQSDSSFYSTQSRKFAQSDQNNSPSPAGSDKSSLSSFTSSQSQLILTPSNYDKSSQNQHFSSTQSQSENNNIDDNRTSSIYISTNSQFNDVINHLYETTQGDLYDEEKRIQIGNQIRINNNIGNTQTNKKYRSKSLSNENYHSSIQNSIDNKSVQNSESESTISESICSSTPSPFQNSIMSDHENDSLNSEDSQSDSSFYSTQSRKFAQSDQNNSPSPAGSDKSSLSSFTSSQSQLILTPSNYDKSSQNQHFSSTQSQSENKLNENNTLQKYFYGTNSQFNDVINNLQETTQAYEGDKEKRIQIGNQNGNNNIGNKQTNKKYKSKSQRIINFIDQSNYQSQNQEFNISYQQFSHAQAKFSDLPSNNKRKRSQSQSIENNYSSIKKSKDNKSESESTSSDPISSTTPSPYQSLLQMEHENDSLYSYKSQSNSSYYSAQSRKFAQSDQNTYQSPAISEISSPSPLILQTQLISSSSNLDKSSQQQPFSQTQQKSENSQIEDNTAQNSDLIYPDDETHENDLNSNEIDVLQNLTAPQQIETNQFYDSQHDSNHSQSSLSDSSPQFSLDSYSSFDSISSFDSDYSFLSEQSSQYSDTPIISQIKDGDDNLSNNKNQDIKQQIMNNNEQQESAIIGKYQSIQNKNFDCTDLNSISSSSQQS